MTDADKSDLRARAIFCLSNGYTLACLDRHIASLGGGEAPEGIETGSLEHLIALLDAPAAEVAEAPPAPPAEPTKAEEPAPAPPAEEPKTEEKPAEEEKTEEPKAAEVEATDEGSTKKGKKKAQ